LSGTTAAYSQLLTKTEIDEDNELETKRKEAQDTITTFEKLSQLTMFSINIIEICNYSFIIFFEHL